MKDARACVCRSEGSFVALVLSFHLYMGWVWGFNVGLLLVQ